MKNGIIEAEQRTEQSHLKDLETVRQKKLEREAKLRNQTRRKKVDNDVISYRGVTGPCALDELSNFKMARNQGFDPMHDLLEGVVQQSSCSTFNGILSSQ
uniref:(northern house mosquito) hypothetical protein n=1 Tax=Culex pipiens TaxID=7175 RepID=A0A8D8E838_CULPI